MEEEQTPAPLFDWRAYLVIHPAADEYPLLRETDPASFRALVEDVRINGMHTSLTFWIDNDGRALLVDGRNRLDVLAEIGALGVERKYEDDEDDEEDHLVYVKDFDGTAWVPLDQFHQRRVDRWSEKVRGDPYALSLSYNTHRRMLTPEEKHARIEAAIKRNPEKSLRQIGKLTGNDKNTVGEVKAKMVATGEVSPVEKTVGADGKARKQPAKRSGGPRHKCWQCGVRAAVGEVQQHSYADLGSDVWLHPTCVAAFEAEFEAEEEAARERQTADDDPTASAARRMALNAAADDAANPSAGNGAAAELTKEESLAARIQLEWSEAAAAFENLTSHAVAQIAAAIPHAERKQAADRATEYANLFQALAAQLASKH